SLFASSAFSDFNQRAKALLQFLQQHTFPRSIVIIVVHPVRILNNQVVELHRLRRRVIVKETTHSQRYIERVASRGDAHEMLYEIDKQVVLARGNRVRMGGWILCG